MRNFILLLVLARGPSAFAQVPEVGHKCVDNCGGDSSSSSSSSSDGGRAYREDDEMLKRIDSDNEDREHARERIHRIRSENLDGVAAYKHKQWKSAIRAFEAAARLAPNDWVIQSNLAAARRALDDEAAARAAPKHSEPPPPATPARPVDATAPSIRVSPIAIHAATQSTQPQPGWTQVPAIELSGALDAARKQQHEALPLLQDFTKDLPWQVVGHVTGTAGAIDFMDSISDAKQTSEKYNELARGLVDQASSAAHETVSILGGGDGDAQHVLDTPQRMVHMVDQFVEERLQADIWGKIKGWGGSRIGGALKPEP